MLYKLSVWDDLVQEVIGESVVTDWNLALQSVELGLARLAEIHPDYLEVYFEVVKPDGKCFTYRLVNGEWEVENALRLGYGGTTIQIYDNPKGGWVKGMIQKNTGYGYELSVEYVEPITSATQILDCFPNLLGLGNLD
jgi:hypothetical protein